MGFWLLLAVQPTKSQSFKRVADIFEEIDEELKQDQFYGWWKKYGKIIIVVVSILILATGAFYWWDSYQKKQIEGQASALTAAVALVSESKNDEAKLAFEALIADGGTYGMLAGFEQAKLALSTGDKEAISSLAYFHLNPDL